MTWDSNGLTRLEGAAASFDREEVAAICDALLAHLVTTDELFPETDAKRVLTVLRRKRYFQLLQRVADGFILSGQVSATMYRQFAQSLIDQGNMTAAIAVLNGMLFDPGIEESEKAEAKGLIGRAWKQIYVNSPRVTAHQKRALAASIEAYYSVYRAEPTVFTWQGINAVALKMRAERDKVAVDVTFNAKSVAQSILATINQRPEEDLPAWDLATAAEACIALGQLDEALRYCGGYLASPKVDAFEVASFLRQVREIWQVDESHPLRALPVALEAALLKRQGGRVEFASGTSRAAMSAATEPDVEQRLERVFGSDGPVPLKWYRRALDLVRGIARIGNQWQRTLGTGFLVRAGDFFPERADLPPDERLLLTNAHVLGSTHPMAVRAADALVEFAESDAPGPYRVMSILWESRADVLDATLARLTRPPAAGIPTFPRAPGDPPTFKEGDRRRLFVIGHPGGDEMAISLHDNLQVGWEFPRLHYRTPTLPGSSGSPVFDADWNLIALHHAGSPKMPRLDGQPGIYQANEGIWIHALIAATRNAPTGASNA